MSDEDSGKYALKREERGETGDGKRITLNSSEPNYYNEKNNKNRIMGS